MTKSGIAQYAFVVSDIEKSVDLWANKYGAGPFYLMPHVKIDDMKSHGLPVNFDYSGAVGQCGGSQIEIIQQHDDQRSLYTEVLKDEVQVFHHVARIVDDFSKEIADWKMISGSPALEGRFGQIEFAYFDTRPLMGCMTEILGRSQAVLEMFDRVRLASEAWDGSRPLRPISELI